MTDSLDIQAKTPFPKMSNLLLIAAASITIISIWNRIDCHPIGTSFNSLLIGDHVESPSLDPEETIGHYDHGRGSLVAGRDRTVDYRCRNGLPIEECPPHVRLVVDPPFTEEN